MRRVTRARLRAFTLVEVMVALVVMSVGMLAISILFVEGLRIHRMALHRAAAVGLAADMAERIRATGRGPLAGHERAEWQRAVRDHLPVGATGEVIVKPDRHDIRLRWPETGRAAEASYELSMHPPAR